ncbi:MAG: methyltransferase domain-containing protein [Bdellovibrionota bacterium]
MIIDKSILLLIGLIYSLPIKFFRLIGFIKDIHFDPRADWARKHLSYKYLRGHGLEIGALHKALRVRPTVEVKYVDRFEADELRNQYPELGDLDIIDPDVVDNGETLETVADNSQDFIIANHFIEHCLNPIQTIENHLRKLNEGGILFYTVPHRDNTFDSNRPLTSVEHLVQDYDCGGEVSRVDHFREFARYTKGVPENEVINQAAQLIKQDYSIHYHVWTPETFESLLLHLKDKLDFSFEILEVVEWKYARFEFILILRKKNSSRRRGEHGVKKEKIT